MTYCCMSKNLTELRPLLTSAFCLAAFMTALYWASCSSSVSKLLLYRCCAVAAEAIFGQELMVYIDPAAASTKNRMQGLICMLATQTCLDESCDVNPYTCWGMCEASHTIMQQRSRGRNKLWVISMLQADIYSCNMAHTKAHQVRSSKQASSNIMSTKLLSKRQLYITLGNNAQQICSDTAFLDHVLSFCNQ